jgi:hypothetical protein
MTLAISLSLASICALAPPQDAGVQEKRPPARSIDVSGGPLAFFKRDESLFAYDPELWGDTQLVYVAPDGHSIPDPVARPAKELLVVEQDSHSRVLNLRKGTVTPLLEGEYKSEVIAVDGKLIFALEHHQAEEPKRSWLYKFEFGAHEKPERITELEFEELVFIEPNAFWLVVAADERCLVRVGRDGSGVLSIPRRMGRVLVLRASLRIGPVPGARSKEDGPRDRFA